MPRNLEIKARARDFPLQARIAAALADQPAREVKQVDTFFRVPSGRLKLRVFDDGSGELIQYERADSKAPVESRYTRFPTKDPMALREALERALGVLAVVRKSRIVCMAGSARIHLDRVDGLGEFIELEVALDPEGDADEAMAASRELMSELQIDEAELVAEAYIDMLAGLRS